MGTSRRVGEEVHRFTYCFILTAFWRIYGSSMACLASFLVMLAVANAAYVFQNIPFNKGCQFPAGSAKGYLKKILIFRITDSSMF